MEVSSNFQTITPEQLYKVLIAVTSQDISKLKPAEEILKLWESLPHFYLSLTKIFLNVNLDLNIRWMSVLYFKNGIDKYWRRNAPGTINENEKIEIRSLLENSFNEPNHQIILQLVVVVSKIARLDCPTDWPNLLNILINSPQAYDESTKAQHFLFLRQVFKSLASRRLPNDRIYFQQISSIFYEKIIDEFDKNMVLLFQITNCETDALQPLLELSRLTIKILNTLITFGIPDISDNVKINTFINNLFLLSDMLIKHGSSFQNEKDIILKEEKVLKNISKLWLNILDTHQNAFSTSISKIIDLFLRECIQELTVIANCNTSFKINLFEIITRMLKCEAYMTPKKISTSCEIICSRFDTNTIHYILRAFFNNYFKYSNLELELWSTDPESFVSNTKETESNIFRLSAENLFLELTKNFLPIVLNNLTGFLKNAESQSNFEDIKSVLLLDSVYKAFGLASYELIDMFDFNEWFIVSLIPILKKEDVYCQILHWRVLWILSKWVRVTLTNTLQSTLYEIVSHFLRPNINLVLRVGALRVLNRCIDDVSFEKEIYSNFLGAHLGFLLGLFEGVYQCELKVEVLAVITLIVEQMSEYISSYCELISEFLLSIWNLTDEFLIIKVMSLNTYTNLIEALGNNSTPLHANLIKILTHCMDTQFVYFSEDALILWLTIVKYCPSKDITEECFTSDELLMLFGRLITLIDTGTDALKVELKILEAYIVLYKEIIFKVFGESLKRLISSLFNSLNNEGMLTLLKVIDTSLRAAFELTCSCLVDVFIQILKSFVNEDDNFPVVVTTKLVLLSRIVLKNPSYLFSLLHSVNIPVQVLVKSWINQIDNIFNPENRKIITMGIVTIIINNLSYINVEELNMMINICIEGIHICNKKNNEWEDDLLIEFCADSTPHIIECAHYIRLQIMAKDDITYTVSYPDFLKKSLSTLDFNLIEKLDKQLIQQLTLILT